MEVLLRALNENDYVTKSQREAEARIDPTDNYGRETVRTTVGPKDTAVDVVVRFPIGHEFGRAGFFVFACYDDNPDWHKRPEAEWLEIAKRALTKFAASAGVSSSSARYRRADTR